MSREAMDRDTVIALAREAGVKPLLYDGKWAVENLDVFAALVAAHEREACAKVCEELRDDWLRGLGRYEFMGEGADYCADAIRSRT